MKHKLDSQYYTLRGGINIIKWGITSQTVYDEVVEGINSYISVSYTHLDGIPRLLLLACKTTIHR